MPNVNFVLGSKSGPPPVLTRRERYTVDLTWTGWDGSRWDLSGGTNGVVLRKGARGLHIPPGTRYRDTSPGAPGSQHRGTQWHERPVFWPIKLWNAAGGAEFVARDKAFWRTMDPDRAGRWTATQLSGEARYLDLRYDPAATTDEGYDTMPTIQEWAHYAVYLTADQPFWTGKPSSMIWKAPTSPGQFFEPTGPHLFNIGQSFSLETASIDNLGDVESPPVWYIDGASEPGAWVGVGDRRTTIPFAVPVNQCLVIDSDPTRIGATLYNVAVSGRSKNPSDRIIGVDMTNPRDYSKQLGENDFVMVPPGESVKLSLSLAGSGQIEASVPNYYKRAW